MVMLALITLGAMTASPRDTLDAEALFLHLDESGEEYAEIVERLEEFRRRPIDVNSCTIEDLLDLPIVSAAEAKAVTDHRREHGLFTSPRALREVDGLNAATLERILAFVTVRPPPQVRKRPSLRADFIQRWTRKLERAEGFRRDSSGYLGGPNVLQTRIRISLGKLSAGVTLDKDAGEPMNFDVRRPSLGYDFMSGHIQLESVGGLRRLVVGDFSPRFGHGVLLRAPGSIRLAAPANRGGAASLRPSASASESGHFRGVGIELTPADWLTLVAFASRRNIDAGIDTTGGEALPAVSRRATGLHRTSTERNGRGALRESAIGGALRSAFGPISMSAAFFSSDEVWVAPLAGPQSLPRRVSTFSLSAGATFGAVHVGAEFAPAAGLSAMMEVRSGRHSRLRIAMRRALDAVYLPTSALAGGSDGLTDEVTDIAVLGRHRLSTATKLDFALEHAVQNAPQNRRPFATIRSAANVVLSHTPMPWLTLTIRGTERRSEDADVCADGAVRCLGPATRRTLRFQIDYLHSRHVECRLRGEYVRAEATRHATLRSESSHGFLIYEELRLRPTDALQIAGRLAVFSADQHSARIYTYESDLTYAFSSPSFAGRGRRAYALIRWKTARAVTFEAKWSQTVQEDVNSTGTGRDKVDGGRLREIRIQIRLRLQ